VVGFRRLCLHVCGGSVVHIRGLVTSTVQTIELARPLDQPELWTITRACTPPPRIQTLSPLVQTYTAPMTGLHPIPPMSVRSPRRDARHLVVGPLPTTAPLLQAALTPPP
jgi:hypothetical protein